MSDGGADGATIGFAVTGQFVFAVTSQIKQVFDTDAALRENFTRQMSQRVFDQSNGQ